MTISTLKFIHVVPIVVLITHAYHSNSEFLFLPMAALYNSFIGAFM